MVLLANFQKREIPSGAGPEKFGCWKRLGTGLYYVGKDLYSVMPQFLCFHPSFVCRV